VCAYIVFETPRSNPIDSCIQSSIRAVNHKGRIVLVLVLVEKSVYRLLSLYRCGIRYMVYRVSFIVYRLSRWIVQVQVQVNECPPSSGECLKIDRWIGPSVWSGLAPGLFLFVVLSLPPARAVPRSRGLSGRQPIKLLRRRRRRLAHHDRQAVQHGAVPLVVVLGEAALQDAPQRGEPDPLPPAVDAHDALAADLDRALAAVVAVGVAVDGGAVHGAPAGVLDRREDGGEVGVQRLLVALVDALARDGGEGLQLLDELRGVVVGVVALDEAGAVAVLNGGYYGGVVFGVIFNVVGVFVVLLRRVALLVEQGNVLARGDLHAGLGAVELVDEDADRVFAFVLEIVDLGREEAPFLQGRGDAARVVARVDGMAVGRDNVEEEVHLVEEGVLCGTAEEGAGAEAVDGGGLDDVRGRVADGPREQRLDVLVDGVVGGGDGEELERPQGERRLAHAGLVLDAPGEGTQQVWNLTSDLLLDIVVFREATEGGQRLLAALDAAAFAVQEVLDAVS